MSDIKLSLPSSATPLASSGPVGEARGIGADASPEDAATAFANLLQDSLKNAPEDPRAALLAKLLDDGSGAPDDEKVDLLDALSADPARIATELLPVGLLVPAALSVVERLSGRGDAPVEQSDLDLDLTGQGGRKAGREASGDLPAAAIAAATDGTGEANGKNLPDALLAGDSRMDVGQPATPQLAQGDFRAHLSTAQKPATEMAVATPITHPGWADDIGHQVTWLAENGNSRAELILTPPHLGRIEISLQIGGDLSTAQFVSANPQVREALEQAMPRLREMLAEGGISLGDTNVSGEQRSGEQGQGGQRGERGRDGNGEGELLIAPAARRGSGLVDLFA
ncbi:flagellar hook-length control FliK family protein [Methyloversatilis sp. RAC08]|uniref:flagellar hook-length control protein FliK n=1 Tax=Methyloversatilis sp. RAC08 TaxID=1842540 RepID=UPI00083D31E7|nr:flagellar hook-length control protein FliK [Methyloversatilis sp. RAC08]AOF82331.1 flagellar hook-length control FliK family protein [Methyloversatilis sp. RAC08]